MDRRSLLQVGVVAAITLTALILGQPKFGTGGEVHVVRPPAEPADSLIAAGVPGEVTEFLRNGQAWRAARAMRRHIAAEPDQAPEAILLAARAEAGWGGWSRAADYLRDRPWLDSLRAGESWFWLGRAHEEAERWDAAMDAYSRYLRIAPETATDDRRRIAELRQGLILLRRGRVEEGAALLQRMREHAPGIAGRVNILAAEALSTRGDTAGVRALVPGDGDEKLARRGRVALVEAHLAARSPATALSLARAFRAGAEDDGERAVHGIRAARISFTLGDTAGGRRELLAIVRGAPSVTYAREAAELLTKLPGLVAGERLELAKVLDRHGANRSAATEYARWLASSTGSEAERKDARLRLGRALFDAADYPASVRALTPLIGATGQIGAEALLLVGRAEYRRGNRARANEVLTSLARRHPGSGEGAEGLFLVADLSHDAGNVSHARQLYRRVASEFRGTDRAGLSLMRLGAMAFVARDFRTATTVWEEYRSTYPGGDRYLESTYWAGRALEAGGDRPGAEVRYRLVRTSQPLSYYSERAALRLKEAYWPVPMDSAPAEDPAVRARVEQWLHGIDLLREAGLHEEAEAEADARITRAGDDAAVLYPLAETLNERGYTVRGIRTGMRLERAAARTNPRLLRILYPFPYRGMIEAEAREKKLDPFLVAALIRQESMFKARIASPVGARGLMQVMPETGRGIARAVGIDGWDPELLYQPEINAHLGTLFLAEQMRAHRESLPSVFSAYNAGPHRVQRWKRYPEYADEELFTERIPYRETRDYVKILTRNAAIYRGLYGKVR